MDKSLDKQALIQEIEKLIESDPLAHTSTFEMMDFLEIDDLISTGLVKDLKSGIKLLSDNSTSCLSISIDNT